MPNQLVSLQVAGFRSLRDVSIDLTGTNVLIGANGAGKSNLLKFLQLLGFLGTEGLGEFVGRSGGAAELLYRGARQVDTLSFHLKFALEKGTAHYRCRLGHASGGALLFLDEELAWQPAGRANITWSSLGGGHRESKLRAASLDGDRTAKTIHWSLNRCRHFHFHDTSDQARVRNPVYIDDNRYLRSDAGNLAAYLYRLGQTHQNQRRKVTEIIQQIAPFIADFELEPSALRPDQISLDWRDKRTGHVFGPSALSDGTLRSAALVTMFLQPDEDLPILLAIDEPELGLHPFAIGVVAALAKDYGTRGQLVVSTQSPALLDYFEPEDIIVVDRDAEATTLRRLTRAELADWLDEFTLSELWQKNITGGGPG